MVPSRFGNVSNLAGGNCHRSAVWLCSSVVRELAWYVRGPEFESWLDHSPVRTLCFFLPCDVLLATKLSLHLHRAAKTQMWGFQNFVQLLFSLVFLFMVSNIIS